MRDILCVGEMLIDFLPGNEPGSYLRRAGGAPANVAVAAAKQGLKSGFCGKMGDDDFGRFLVGTLKQNGVENCVPELTGEAVTTMAFVSLDENGDRSFTFARKPGADMLLGIEDVERAGIEDTLIVHAGSCSLSKAPASEATVYAMKKACELGRIVSFDVNYRNVMWDDDSEAAAAAVRGILPYVDLLKISDEEVDMIGGEEAIPEIMKKYGITLTVETLGSRGARWFFGGESDLLPSVPSECVDTCGAGDAFWGCTLASMIRMGVRAVGDITREIIEEAVRRGNIAGALCVRKKGAMESLPTAADIDAFVKG